jgi:hypothetical protein
MSGHFTELARGANNNINIQRERRGILSIIQFSHYATIIYERNKFNIDETDRSSGGPDFASPLRVALEFIKRNPPEDEPRILCFTDGQAGIPTQELSEIRPLAVRMDVIGYGCVNQKDT